MKLKIVFLLAMLGLLAEANAQEHALSGRAGFLGLGIEYSYSVNERIVVRGMLFGSGYSFDATESGIDYEFDLEWDSLAAAVDFHPLTGPFRLTFGLMKNDNGLSASSTPADNLLIGDTIYTPAEIGSLSASIGFDGTAPFVALGWDWSRSKRFGFSLDLGLVKQGAPVVAMRASGTLLGDPVFAADIDTETAELRDALDGFDMLPFASAGIVFRF